VLGCWAILYLGGTVPVQHSMQYVLTFLAASASGDVPKGVWVAGLNRVTAREGPESVSYEEEPPPRE